MDLIQCSTLPLKAITVQLGYSAMTSCGRAFKAWTGQDHKNYRNRLWRLIHWISKKIAPGAGSYEKM